MKNKTFTIKIFLEQHEKEALLRACKFHKMTINQFIEFAIKTKIREDNPSILQENKFFLYTAKEERALRRIRKIKLREDV